MYAKQPLVVHSALQDVRLKWQGSMLQIVGKKNHWSEYEIAGPSGWSVKSSCILKVWFWKSGTYSHKHLTKLQILLMLLLFLQHFIHCFIAIFLSAQYIFACEHLVTCKHYVDTSSLCCLRLYCTVPQFLNAFTLYACYTSSLTYKMPQSRPSTQIRFHIVDIHTNSQSLWLLTH